MTEEEKKQQFMAFGPCPSCETEPRSKNLLTCRKCKKKNEGNDGS